jgi:uncharacterized protein (TIGR00251 family)
MILEVKVKPRSRSSQLLQAPDGSWIARLKSPPVDGRANGELVGLVAAHFGLPRTAVTIRSGASGRLKLVEIRGRE